MVYFKISNNSNNFVNIIKKINSISNDIILHFDCDGLNICGMNYTNNLFYHLEIKKDYFEIFSLRKNNIPEILSISMINLCKILKLFIGNYILEFLYENNKIKLICKNENKKSTYIINTEHLPELYQQFNRRLINIKDNLPILLEKIILPVEYIDNIKYRFQEFNDLLLKINFINKILKIQSFFDDYEIEFTCPINIILSDESYNINETSLTIPYKLFINSLEFTKIFSDMIINIYSNNVIKINFDSNNITLEVIIR